MTSKDKVPSFKFWQRTELTNHDSEPDRLYGWPKHLVGKGIELTIKIDGELEEVMPDTFSRRLGYFIQETLAQHYACRADMPGTNKSTSIHTTSKPWPLPRTVKEVTLKTESRCESCNELRPVETLSVTTCDVSAKHGFSPGTCTQNFQHCGKESCVATAQKLERLPRR